MWLPLAATGLLIGSLAFSLAGCTKPQATDANVESNTTAGGVGGVSEGEYANQMKGMQPGEQGPGTGGSNQQPYSGGGN